MSKEIGTVKQNKEVWNHSFRRSIYYRECVRIFRQEKRELEKTEKMGDDDSFEGVAKEFIITQEDIDRAESILAQDTKVVPKFWVDKYEREAARNWDMFYKNSQHSFFKDRQYLDHEFPEIKQRIQENGTNKETLLVEIGCGVGNCLIPILKNNVGLTVKGFDYSENAVKLLFDRYTDICENEGMDSYEDEERKERCPEEKKERCPEEKKKEEFEKNRQIRQSLMNGTKEKPEKAKGGMVFKHEIPNVKDAPHHLPFNAKVNSSKIGHLSTLYTLDVSKNEIPLDFCSPGTADFVIFMFVLSAISPADFSLVCKRAAQLLKPGGILFIRDYGRYDLAQLRFASSARGSKIGDNFYVRGDGTRAYYFTPEEFETFFVKENGLVTLENKYFTREVKNRKTEVTMRRIWLQGKFQKPLE